MRGGDIDRNGCHAGLGLDQRVHFASFWIDGRCKGTAGANGLTALGQQCPEGWTLFPLPGPTFKGTVGCL